MVPADLRAVDLLGRCGDDRRPTTERPRGEFGVGRCGVCVTERLGVCDIERLGVRDNDRLGGVSSVDVSLLPALIPE